MKYALLFALVFCGFIAKAQTAKKKDVRGLYSYETGAPARTIGTSDTSTVSIPARVFSVEDLKLGPFGMAKRNFDFSTYTDEMKHWRKGKWTLSGDTVLLSIEGKEEKYYFEHVYLKAIEAPHGYQKILK